MGWLLVLLALFLGGCVFVDSPLSVQISISPPTLTITRQAPPATVVIPAPALYSVVPTGISGLPDRKD